MAKDTLDDIIEARQRAARAAKYRLRQEQILLGKMDDQRPVVRALSEIQRERLFAQNGVVSSPMANREQIEGEIVDWLLGLAQHATRSSVPAS